MNRFNPVKSTALAVICLLSVGAIATFKSEAKAQDSQGCFMINESGQLTDLSSICGYSSPRPKRPEGEEPAASSVRSYRSTTPPSTNSSSLESEQYIQDTRFNPNLYFRTPQGISTRDLEIRGDLCAQDYSATCNELAPRIDSLSNSATYRQIREEQQTRVEEIFSE